MPLLLDWRYLTKQREVFMKDIQNVLGKLSLKGKGVDSLPETACNKWIERKVRQKRKHM